MAKVLLVEDDEIQRMAYRRFLELDKHVVKDVADGNEALRIFERNPREFDVVVTDVLMPGLDGTALIYGLHKLRRDVRVIAISAGRRVLTPEFALQSAKLAGSLVQLAKPFTRGNMSAAMESVLGARI